MAFTWRRRDHATTKPVPDLGLMRTTMAADRTLMAWIRTALSLLSFGFTIYKVLQEVEKSASLPRQSSPRNAGIFLAAAGTAAIVMGTMEYWQTLHELHEDRRFWEFRPTLIMAVVMCVAGVFLFVGILSKLL